ncbi:hypothetical protein KR767_13350 [Luteibacter anthropi]|uniref:pilus assembly protein n=1 Tax=Luteibacter anthropi TaxID=564369 RepID=UPI002032B64F|nr:PilC/PilY family type IV pilus protein [Luteibacter anthropi]URX61071.1 hypothetical protein KR767_13350 [Luteibacter anthropi]
MESRLTLHRASAFVVSFAVVLFGGWSGDALSRTTDLSPTPPDLTTTVAPNVAVTFDDSGSMASNFMGDTRPFDGNNWTNDPWRCAGVIDPRVSDKDDRRSSAMNGVYYNPNINYTPPVYADGTAFPNADATLSNVWLDGIDVNRPTNASKASSPSYYGNVNGSNSSSDSRTTNMLGVIKGGRNPADNRWGCNSGTNGPFDGNTPDANGLKPTGGPYYYRLKSGVNITNADGSIKTSTLYVSSNWEPVAVTTDQYQNFANWYAYYRTRNLMTRTTLSQAFSKIGDTIRIAWQSMTNSQAPGVTFNSTTTMQNIGVLNSTVRQNMYNWIFQVAGAYTTPARAATIRAGNLFARSLTKDSLDPYWNGATGTDSADLVCRKNFHMLVTDGYWNERDPSPPAPGNGVAALSSATTSNSAQTLPDNTAYSPTASVSKIYGNVASGDPAIYTTSMANIAWYYWATDLQPKLTNGVKPYWQDLSAPTGVKVDPNNPGATPAVYWNPANDPATWQHVSQFYVTLGVAGTLDYPNDYTALLNGTKAWPYPVNNSGEAVDDTWHGAVNSRGGFFNASNPATLVASLINIINSVIAASSSAVSATLNTGVLGANSLTYTPGFQSSDWTGSFTASRVLTNGSLGSVVWQAGPKLDARQSSGRLIATSSGPGTGTGIPFTDASIKQNAATLYAILNSSDGSGSTGSQDKLAPNRIAWIGGSRVDEGVLLRARSTVLGAIVNSQPVYVSYPSGGYRDFFPPSADGTAAPETTAYQGDATKAYSQFVANNLTRAPTVYVGANDGMLHAFDATDAASGGSERWAFVPSAVYGNLVSLSAKQKTSDAPIQYNPTVDASPIYRDVYFSQGGAGAQGWHTILVGGLRLGGRGVYALDITNPVAGSTSDVASKVLWEFTSTSKDGTTNTGANLGYTFGTPNVGRLSNGKWVVLVPAGYFPSSTDPAPAAASNMYSSLFVLDAQTGKLLKEFKTPTTYNGASVESWGLGSPVLGDYNNDQIDDVAFAGDLAGNLWRFDLTNLTAGNVDLLYQPASVGDQPITVMPRLFPDPTSQYFIVVFGTGKYLGLEDRTTVNAKTQAVYGIRDPGLATGAPSLPVKLASLLQQQLAEDTTTGARGLTRNTITASSKGWYFNLNISGVLGEKVVATPVALFDTNRVIITTLIPTSADPCDPGRAGALIVADAASGGAADGVSGNGSFASGYYFAGGRLKNVAASGGITVATLVGGGTLVLPGTTPAGGTSGKNSNTTLTKPIWRRRSWRILNDQ